MLPLFYNSVIFLRNLKLSIIWPSVGGNLKKQKTKQKKHEMKNSHDAVIKLFVRVLSLNDILMTSSICTTEVELKIHIHDTIIMASWQPMSKPTSWQFNVMLTH